MTIHARRLADSSAPAQKASREKACFSQIVSTGLECDTFAAYAAGGVLFMFTGFLSETLICIHLVFSYSFLIKSFNFIKKTPPDGVVVSVIFGIENHRNPSHYDLHTENFNSDE